MLDRLIQGWKDSDLENVPHLYREDEPLFSSLLERRSNQYRSLGEYVESEYFGNPNDRSLHMGLLPEPYIGNLKKASVFILMLNPGLHAGDYYAEEQHDSQFRRALIRNIRQENAVDAYPFLFLNPEFSWHPGFAYFHERFDRLAWEIKPKIGTYLEALGFLAWNVACLELIPYHSKSFGRHALLLSKLPSTKAMLAFARGELIDRAKRDEVTIIVTRGARYWKLPKQKNVILYEGGETRAAHLTPKSEKEIIARLGL